MIDNEQINPFQLNESDTIPVNINSVNRNFSLIFLNFCFFFILVNISNNEALNEASNLALNIQNPSNEAQATTSNVNAINNDVNNFFDDQFFKHWLLDLVITINIWHIFSITAIYCYLYKISALYLIFVLIIYDVYNLLFLIKKLKNHK